MYCRLVLQKTPRGFVCWFRRVTISTITQLPWQKLSDVVQCCRLPNYIHSSLHRFQTIPMYASSNCTHRVTEVANVTVLKGTMPSSRTPQNSCIVPSTAHFKDCYTLLISSRTSSTWPFKPCTQTNTMLPSLLF